MVFRLLSKDINTSAHHLFSEYLVVGCYCANLHQYW